MSGIISSTLATPFLNYTALQGGGAGSSVLVGLPTPLVNGNLLLAWVQLVHPEAAPSVNANTTGLTGNISTTNFTPALPAGGVAGDVVISWCSVYGNVTIGTSAGWTVPAGVAISDANMSSIWVYRQLTGSDTACTFSWTGAQAVHGDSFLIHGNLASGFLGANNKASGVSTTITAAALTTTSANSFIVGILSDKNGAAVPRPANYFQYDKFTDGVGGSCFAYQRGGASGSSTDAISVTITSNPWHSYLIEILCDNASTDWRQGGMIQDNLSSGWAWRYIDGSQTSPTFYFPGVAGFHARCAEISGVVGSNPIGATNNATASSSSLITAASLSLVSSKSVALGLLLASGLNIPSTPSQYTSIGTFGDGNASDNFVYEWRISQSSSDAISQAIGTCNWNTYAIEVKMT